MESLKPLQCLALCQMVEVMTSLLVSLPATGLAVRSARLLTCRDRLLVDGDPGDSFVTWCLRLNLHSR